MPFPPVLCHLTDLFELKILCDDSLGTSMANIYPSNNSTINQPLLRSQTLHGYLLNLTFAQIMTFILYTFSFILKFSDRIK